MFGHLKDDELCKLKIPALDYTLEEVTRLGDVAYLDASPYEHYKFTIEMFIWIF